MDGDAIVNAIWEARTGITPTSERKKFERAALGAMVEILRGDGWYVLETAEELRYRALEETDLVEPGDA